MLGFFKLFFCYFQVKCHQYWPEGEETLTFGDLEIICTKIRDFSPSYIYREMYVTDSKVLDMDNRLSYTANGEMECYPVSSCTRGKSIKTISKISCTVAPLYNGHGPL